MKLILPAILVSSMAAFAEAPRNAAPPPEKTKAEVPGPQADGAVLLPNQWRLRPAGKQVVVGDFPASMALSPDSKFAAILHCGYGQHEVQILDLGTGKIVSRVNLNVAFYGIAFSPDGSKVVCSGAGDEVLHIFKFKDGYLGDPTEVPLRAKTKRGVPCGLAISGDGSVIYVANVWGQTVSRVRLGADGAADVNDLALAPPEQIGKDVPRVGAPTDEPSITKRAEAILDTTGKDVPFPYACVLDEKRARLYVSLWAQAHVAVIDTKAWKEIARWKAEEHPNEMVLSKDGAHLFVANANRNSVSVIDVESGKTVETLVAELTPDAPPGNTPNSLAISPNGERLFVANANINTVAVFEIEKPGHSRSLGFIPSGWYPTSVRAAKGGKLLIANGKGGVSRANRHFVPPEDNKVPVGVREYIGGILTGTISVLHLPTEEDELAVELKKQSGIAYSCMPETARKIEAAELKGNPIPRKVGDPSPIKHVIYVIKENRTFDQVLGDLGKGNGDPSLCIFGEDVTPNHHALARDFVTLDNFYVESEVSADGHEWSMAAYATDFVEKTWPISYGHGSAKFPYPAEGVFPIATPAGGYLWDRAAAHGVSYRSYGEFTTSPKNGQPGKAKVKGLEGHIDPEYHTFDMGYPDVKRAARFVSELQRFEKEGEMPRLQIVRLPNDHTSGASPGKPTPVAHVADNDLAVGMLVEAVSKSKFWASTAIFVVEDDAQNGPDHVDAHRTIAFAISPYTRGRGLDSTLYSTASMLRTMELILGLKPMSQFDALAMPMFASFQERPDMRPYERKIPLADLNEVTKKTAWGVKETSTMDLTKEDAADDLLLNEVIWRNIRGANSPMPAPVRRAWVLAGDADDAK